MKIAGGASLRGMIDGYILADVDAFSGNSGSGVFDDEGVEVGILVAGNDDWRRDHGCNVIDVIDPVPEGDGEQLTPVSVAIDAYCATGAVSPVCGVAEDAGAAIDAGAAEDAGAAIDGGVFIRDAGSAADAAIADQDAGDAPMPAGCGCRASSSGQAAAWPLALAAIVLRRRRGCRRVDSAQGSRRRGLRWPKQTGST
jgi:MYXO-CTERM domain-containing protein